MKAGVGYHNQKNAFLSGINTAQSAIKNGGIEKPSLVLAFCGGQVDGEDFFKGLRSVVGTHVPIMGGSAMGIITNSELCYEGFPAGAAILELDDNPCRIASADSLDKDEMRAGKRLAQGFSGEREGKLLLVFYDSVKHSPTTHAPLS